MNNVKANKLHIGIFGKRNVGKSTLMNKLLGQDYSIISDVPGTTTDVNQKSMELLPIGPVVLLDTAGVDDMDELGLKRVEKTYKALERVDCAIFVCDCEMLCEQELTLLKTLRKKQIPVLILINKIDLNFPTDECVDNLKMYSDRIVPVSLNNTDNITDKIKNELKHIIPDSYLKNSMLLSDIISEGNTVVMVVPIDKEAPKDRLILPQVQLIRSMLDNKCVSVVCGVQNLSDTLLSLKKAPKLVITDSQAFAEVSEIVPNEILLTSFSIIFAYFKGDLNELVLGANKIDSLTDGDKILICESCTHHPIGDDIGRVKIPNLLKKFTSKNLTFENYSGYDFPTDISKYSLIIHCGACMTNRIEVLHRISIAKEYGIPITNYGVAIAKCLGILQRSIQPFEKIICFD